METFEEGMMRRAMKLAIRGGGFVNPNPRVGCVIVKDGRIIGEGWHQRYGGLHAERNALKNCTEDPRGADLFVTLEPCCHYGKQPPCTDAILEAGIGRVIIGSRDPNPLVHGKGAKILRNAGIEVVEDVLRDECDRLNESFFHYITTKTPFVTLKYAMTLDGKIASCTGESQWITGEEARRHVHRTRGENTAILVGSGTVLADNPALTCRDAEGLDPIRIICDSRLRTKPDARLYQDIRTADPEKSRFPRTILATCAGENDERLVPYRKAGVKILSLPEGPGGHLDPVALIRALGGSGIDSLLIEGGGTAAWGFVSAGLVNRVQAYVAPMILGGETAPSPVRGKGFQHLSDALRLRDVRVSRIGTDIFIEGMVIPCSPES